MTSIFHIPSLSNLTAYKSAVKAINDLSFDEEIKLAKQMNSALNDISLKAAQQLILSQLKTVVNIVYQYRHYGIDEGDLIQEGNIGLMKAVKNFDINENVRLYTFSLIWIKSEIQAFILKNWKIVKVGTTNNLKKLFFKFRSSYNEFINQGVSKENIPEKIKLSLNVSQDDIKEIQNYFNSKDIYLDLDSNSTDNEEHIPLLIPNELVDFKTPEYYLSKYRDNENNLNKLKNIINTLDDREKQIIHFKYLTDIKKTNKEISQLLNISSERVRQIEQNTINKIKQNLLNT